jgi:hypothetical protein
MKVATMEEAERQAIVWDIIERMAFKPATDEKKRTWLNLYANGLAKLWNLQEADLQIRRDRGQLASFAVPSLALDCRCTIEGRDNYSVTLSKAADSAQVVFWHLHVDSKYSSRRGYCKPSAEYPQQDEAKYLEGDIEAVLDGMLFHPRNHAHAEDLGIEGPHEQGDLAASTHEVRLGGGIENAFVFLAHVRYQFCLLSEVRTAECRRLRRLFLEAIQRNQRSVEANALLNSRF